MFYVVWLDKGHSDVRECSGEDELSAYLRELYDLALTSAGSEDMKVLVFDGARLAMGGNPRSVTLTDGRSLAFGQSAAHEDDGMTLLAPGHRRGG